MNNALLNTTTPCYMPSAFVRAKMFCQITIKKLFISATIHFAHRRRSNIVMKILELFCGPASTSSIRRYARDHGHEYTGLDIISQPNSICEDFMAWDYTQHPAPDIIWASPPCTTWSKAPAEFHRLNIAKGMTAVTQEARDAELLIARMIQCIHHFQTINPNLVYYIENPEARLNHWPPMLQAFGKPRTIDYCMYKCKRPVKKPTVIWTNSLSWTPRPRCHTIQKENRGHVHERWGTARGSLSARSCIPYELACDCMNTAVHDIHSDTMN